MALHPDTAEHFIEELFRFGRSMRGALADNDNPELLPGSAAVLLTLAMLGEVRQNPLADELCITQSALSRQLGELVSHRRRRHAQARELDEVLRPHGLSGSDVFLDEAPKNLALTVGEFDGLHLQGFYR